MFTATPGELLCRAGKVDKQLSVGTESSEQCNIFPIIFSNIDVCTATCNNKQGGLLKLQWWTQVGKAFALSFQMASWVSQWLLYNYDNKQVIVPIGTYKYGFR